MSFLKGASEEGGEENKNKFEKLTDPSRKRGSLFPSADEEFAWGVCNDNMGHN